MMKIEETEMSNINDDFIYKDDRRKVELVRMIQKTLRNMGYE